MADRGRPADLPPRRGRLYRAACAVVRLLQPLVPAHRREEWRAEWESELWHHLAHGHPRSGLRAALDLVSRVAGALPHALWIRRNEWRLDMIRQDLLYAWRTTWKRPGFALLVVGTLGLGIGANTAMFTIVNSVLIRPLPYDRPDELVFIYGWVARNDRAAVSPPDFLDYRARNSVFASLAARTISGHAILTGNGEPERVSMANVTANFFQTLGVAPLYGRSFLPDEEEGTGHDVAILSYGLWQRRFGADPAVIGTTAVVDGRATRIVGVMPRVLDQTLDFSLWRPLAFHTPNATPRRFHYLRAVGRLNPGVTIPKAQSAMDVIASQLAAAYPENEGWKLRLRPYRDVMVGDVGRALLILLGAVGLVLLIACGNVANLLLARATSRQGEIVIRTALGATRQRLIRQLLTESLLLAAAGGVFGLALAAVFVRAVRIIAAGILPRLAEVHIDLTVLGFTTAISLGTGLVFGLAPALHAVRTDLTASLASLGRGSGGSRGLRARDALVTLQVALSLVLLVGAGLLLRSLWRLQQVEPGFEPAGVLTAELSLPDERYPRHESQQRFWVELIDRVRAIPGVTTTSATTMLPLVGGGDTYYWVEGFEPATAADRRTAMVNVVANDYFETMRVPLVAGRTFGVAERGGAPGSFVISQSMAARLFPGESAVGKRLVADFGKPFTGEIVGVVGDVLTFGLDSGAPDIMYLSAYQSGGWGLSYLNVVIRTAGDPASLAGPVRAAVAGIDRDLPLTRLRTMDDVVSASTSRERFAARLLGGFAAASLLLAVIGLYGVLAYAVTQRTAELGIRLALGARRDQVFALVVRRGMVILAAGIAIGLVTAFGATRLVRGLLFQVGPNDPLVFGLVTVALAAAGLCACVVPARRATMVDPVVALRSEQ